MNPFVHGSTMLRADLFQRIGGYRGSYAEDLDLWMRMAEISRLGICTRLGYYYWRSVSGISYGAHTRQIALIKLYLQLKSERAQFGRENTNWESEYNRITNLPSTETSLEERQASIHYARGIQLLRRGIFKASRAEFKLAAANQGYYAQKARRNLAFFRFAPVLEFLYHLREIQEPFYFAHKLPAGTQLPASPYFS
jgi:hypothetical protein